MGTSAARGPFCFDREEVLIWGGGGERDLSRAASESGPFVSLAMRTHPLPLSAAHHMAPGESAKQSILSRRKARI